MAAAYPLADGCELMMALTLLDSLAKGGGLPMVDHANIRRQANEAAAGLRSIYCTGCGRMSEDCSAGPCADVIADREEGKL